MQSRLIHIIFCIFLVVIGFLLGTFSKISSFEIDSINKIFSMLASLATIVGVIVAFLGINSWRNEFKITKVDSLINDLEDDCNGLFMSFIQHYYVKAELIKKQNSVSSSLEYDDVKKLECEMFFKFRDYEEKYWSSYDRLCRYVSVDRCCVIVPEQLNRKLTEIIQALYKIHDEKNNNCELTESDIFEMLINSKQSCKNEYRALREKYC
ncbi:hypothetical protein [Vibrio cholerae]|uniref:hypothetical protein n=1 Tax=Vibrio cholerae TaxID=666 RepID=UPI001FA6B1A4|nr:hypothetical protein [Vibrio cholerae]MCI4615580.1 hypothetical protein [Vibrio cholerae]GHW44998.1 hypothetical protein VCSRO56_3685 [Vibrio cholerae]